MSTARTAMIGAMLLTCCTAGAALAAERDHGWSRWKAGETEQSKDASKYGPSCQPAFTSRGSGPVGFGITQFWAKRHTTRNWQEAATKLSGADYAKWRKARDKTVTCEQANKEWLCKATASPCK